MLLFLVTDKRHNFMNDVLCVPHSTRKKLSAD